MVRTAITFAFATLRLLRHRSPCPASEALRFHWPPSDFAPAIACPPETVCSRDVGCAAGCAYLRPATQSADARVSAYTVTHHRHSQLTSTCKRRTKIVVVVVVVAAAAAAAADIVVVVAITNGSSFDFQVWPGLKKLCMSNEPVSSSLQLTRCRLAHTPLTLVQSF